MENEGSLSVLFFEVVHGLGTENPIFGFEVGLKNGGGEVFVAGDVDNCLHVFEFDKLLLDIISD